jgi:hypothetical protein
MKRTGKGYVGHGGFHFLRVVMVGGTDVVAIWGSRETTTSFRCVFRDMSDNV